jgi:hypothetical protein
MPKRSNIWQIWLPRGEGMLDGTMPCQICRDVRWNDARTLTVSLSEPVFALAMAFFTPSATSQGSETAGSSLDDERSHSNCSLNLGSSRPAGGSIARRPKSVARVDPPAHLHLPVGTLNSDGPTPGKGRRASRVTVLNWVAGPFASDRHHMSREALNFSSHSPFAVRGRHCWCL